MKQHKKIIAYQLMLPLNEKTELVCEEFPNADRDNVVILKTLNVSGKATVYDMKTILQNRDMHIMRSDSIKLLQVILERADKAKW